MPVIALYPPAGHSAPGASSSSCSKLPGPPPSPGAPNAPFGPRRPRPPSSPARPWHTLELTSTSSSSTRPSPLVSLPARTTCPPSAQFAPGASLSMRTNEPGPKVSLRPASLPSTLPLPHPAATDSAAANTYVSLSNFFMGSPWIGAPRTSFFQLVSQRVHHSRGSDVTSLRRAREARSTGAPRRPTTTCVLPRFTAPSRERVHFTAPSCERVHFTAPETPHQKSRRWQRRWGRACWPTTSRSLAAHRGHVCRQPTVTSATVARRASRRVRVDAHPVVVRGRGQARGIERPGPAREVRRVLHGPHVHHQPAVE